MDIFTAVQSKVVCTSGVSPDPVLISFSTKEITSRLISFRNNALGCVLSVTKQSCTQKNCRYRSKHGKFQSVESYESMFPEFVFP